MQLGRLRGRQLGQRQHFRVKGVAQGRAREGQVSRDDSPHDVAGAVAAGAEGGGERRAKSDGADVEEAVDAEERGVGGVVL